MGNKEVKTEHWSNGAKRKETSFIDGLKHGTQYWWHTNGNKQCIIPFYEGKRHGQATWWNKEGTKDTVINYIKGEKHGLEITWYGNGSLKTVVNYRRGTEIWRIGFPIGELTEYTELIDNLQKISDQGNK